MAAVRGYRHRCDLFRMSLEGEPVLAGLEVPNLQGVVPGAGNGVATVRGYRHRCDLFRMSLEGEPVLAGLEVPNLQGVVP